MTTNWSYSSSRWWRFYFHVHTPASIKCYKKPDATHEEWLKSCMDICLVKSSEEFRGHHI